MDSYEAIEAQRQRERRIIHDLREQLRVARVVRRTDYGHEVLAILSVREHPRGGVEVEVV